MDLLTNLLMSDFLIPQGHCYPCKTELIGLPLGSDLMIAIVYLSIPLTLFYFVQKREDLPFNWIFTLCRERLRQRELAQAQIQYLNEKLEVRVAERTQELEAAMLQGQDLAERMELAIDAARLGVCDWDIIAQKITWNDYHVRLLDYIPGAAEYTYEDWVRRVHPEDLDRVNAALELAMSAHTDYSSEYRIIWEDGSIHWLDGFGRFYYDSQGQAIRMTGLANDITDRKQAEAAMRESEDRFRATFEQAAVGVAHVGLEGQWLRVNQKLCDIVGYTESELLDLTFQDITHPDDLSTDLEYIRQLLAGEIQTYAMEKRYIRKQGEIVWVNLTVSLRRDAAGAPIHFISVVADISDRKQAEFALQEQTHELAKTFALVKQRNQELDQFAHIVSHDLKAPLRAISHLSIWIEDDLAGQVPPETQEYLELMRSRVERMESMINGLLDYARVGQTQVSLSTFSVEDLLAETLDSLSIPPSFRVELPSALPMMTTNRLLLSQVFANLIGNAYKHHDRLDGRIEVTAAVQGKMWEFSVADDGPGIAAEDRDRVFAIFQTLGARDKPENTGIGLSIVKKIIESHDGNISIVERPSASFKFQLNRGIIFRFTWLTAE
jgi:PAS domain S-box-containing protein